MTDIVMHQCNSSQIAEYGYDPEKQLLRIQFRRGGLYEYRGVPEHVFEEFLGAESKGSYHYHNIRSRYSYEKLS